MGIVDNSYIKVVIDIYIFLSISTKSTSKADQ